MRIFSPSFSRRALLPTLLAVFFMMSALMGFMTIGSDGVGYYFLYHQIRERDWSLSESFDPPPSVSQYMFVPSRSGWSTYFQIGTALYWAATVPIFSRVLPSSFDDFAARIAGKPPYLLRDGFALLLSAVVAAGAAWFFTYHVARGFLHSFTSTSLHAALALVFIGMPTWYYTFHSPSYAHIIELAALTASLFFFLKAEQSPRARWYVFCALSVGFAALVRIDALLYLIAYAVFIFMQPRTTRARAISLLLLTAPTLIIASVQFIIWYRVFGTALPPANYTVHDFLFPGLYSFHVLFSNLRGLFLWSPIALVGVVGLVRAVAAPVSRPLGWLGVGLFVLYTIFYGSWTMWWGGSSAGQRFLIPLFPFFVFGVAVLLQESLQWRSWYRRAMLVFCVTALVFTMILALLYDPLFPGDEKEASSLTSIFSTAYHQYAFPLPSSWGPLFEIAYWYDPRLLHYISYLYAH